MCLVEICYDTKCVTMDDVIFNLIPNNIEKNYFSDCDELGEQFYLPLLPVKITMTQRLNGYMFKGYINELQERNK